MAVKQFFIFYLSYLKQMYPNVLKYKVAISKIRMFFNLLSFVLDKNQLILYVLYI